MLLDYDDVTQNAILRHQLSPGLMMVEANVNIGAVILVCFKWLCFIGLPSTKGTINVKVIHYSKKGTESPDGAATQVGPYTI